MQNHIIDEVAYNNAIKRNIINNARKTFLKNPKNAEALDYAESKAAVSEFFRNLVTAFNTYGKLTERQVECILNSMDKDNQKKQEWAAKQAAKNAKSNFIGEVKQRLNLTLTCMAIIPIQGQGFSYYDNGVTYLSIYNDENGNIFTHKGKMPVIEKGEKAVIKATVKQHTIYNGAKQTALTRPTFINMVE